MVVILRPFLEMGPAVAPRTVGPQLCLLARWKVTVEFVPLRRGNGW